MLTVFPALGARRLSKEGVLTRRINAIETLGATTVLCSDKTGTLTENRMTVTHLAAGGVELEDRLALDSVAEASLPEAFHAPGGGGDPGQRGRPLRPDGEGLPSTRRTLPGRHRTPARRLAPGADLCAQPGAARDVARVGGGGRWRADGRRQGCAGSGDGSVPPRRRAEGSHRRRGRRTGRRRSARAGGGAWRRSPARTGPRPNTTSTSSSSGCSAWRTRCAPRCPPRWPSAARRASAWS